MASSSSDAPSNPYGFGFDRLSPTVLYRLPPPKATPTSTTITAPPSIILFFAWMDANPKHVAKYMVGHARLFPTARVLLITSSTMGFLVQSKKQRLTELEPALKILQDLQPGERILQHTFSNGGAAATWLLATAYRERTGSPLPIDKAVYDSAPGKQGYQGSITAFSLALPRNPIVHALGSGVLHVVLGVWFAYLYVIGGETIVETVRKGLNDTNIFDTRTERLYIYSAADKLILSADVEEHAKAAAETGFKVQTVKYMNSGHAAHLLSDEKRYWGAVIALWDSELLSEPGAVMDAW